MVKIDAFEKARNYAFLLLKFRPRSEKELIQRLKKKFKAKVIAQTVTFLKEKRFIDDAGFAKWWLESRLKKPLGLRKLKEELRIKGIDREIIERNIAEIKKDYLEEDIVTEIVEDRLNKLKNTDPQKAKRRLYAYLLRRGFSVEVVIDTLNKTLTTYEGV